jgi:hypothetical protein
MATSYLTSKDITALTEAAISANVVALDRALLLENIRPGYVATLKTSNQPLVQFRLDLGTMSKVERLEDGTVPLEQFLHNIADYLRLSGQTEMAVFDNYASRVSNHTQGIPPLPPPTELPEVLTKEAIVHQDDTVEIGFLAGAIATATSVARISVPRYDGGQQRKLRSGQPWIMNGTGWVVAPDLVLTNHHVVNAREQDEAAASAGDFDCQAKGASVAFGYDTRGSSVEAVDVARVEAADPNLDYAILRLGSSATRPALRLSSTKVVVRPSTYMPVNIIQHPRGLPKRIAFRNNLVSGGDDTLLRYFTDTDFGSSGAPVCDDTWHVVALHRGAVRAENVDFQGKPTAYVNYGLHIQSLMSHVQSHASGLYDEIIAHQIALSRHEQS